MKNPSADTRSANIGLGVVLKTQIGIVGAAWALFLSMSWGMLVMFRTASRVCGMGSLSLFRSSFQGLLVPTVVCGLTALSAHFTRPPDSWPAVLGWAVAAGVAYALAFYLYGAWSEERWFAQALLGR